MNSNVQKVQRSRFIEVATGIGIPMLFFMFRFTAAAAFLVFVFLCIFLRNRSRPTLQVAFALFVAAILIPVDVYIPGWHGPLRNSEHSGSRFVRVLYGLGAHRLDGGEFISGGCIVGLHDTRWRLVWD